MALFDSLSEGVSLWLSREDAPEKPAAIGNRPVSRRPTIVFSEVLYSDLCGGRSAILAATCSREGTPSFLSTFETCLWTVRSERKSSPAMRRLVSPCATNAATSCSGCGRELASEERADSGS